MSEVLEIFAVQGIFKIPKALVMVPMGLATVCALGKVWFCIIFFVKDSPVKESMIYVLTAVTLMFQAIALLFSELLKRRQGNWVEAMKSSGLLDGCTDKFT